MRSTAPDRLPIDEVRPTQLYLSAEKLADVVGWFDFDDPHGSYGRLPAFHHDGDWHLSDGHTRAFVASLAGVEELRIERDRSVREEHDFELYLTCVDWCREEGITRVEDLAGRVLSADRYETEWIERCHRASGRTGE